MNTINCVLLFYNDTFGIVNVLSILSTQNIELWYITIHDVVHAPVAVDDRRRWMQIIIWFLVVVDLFQRSVWGHSSGDEHSGRTRQTEGWKGNVNTEYSMLEDAENALVLASPWPWPWLMIWWSIVDRFEEVCWLLPASKEGREGQRIEKKLKRHRGLHNVIQRSRQMTSYGTVVIRSDKPDVIYFTFVGDVEERKERITGQH